MTTLIFRQGGNNSRIGNTFVWVERAKTWCQENGFNYVFRQGIDTLGDIFENLEEYFGLKGSNLLESIFFADNKAYSELFGRIAYAAKNIPSRKKAELYQILPNSLAIIRMAGVVWDEDIAEKFRLYDYVIVDEPFPFATPEPIPEDALIKIPIQPLIRDIVSNSSPIYAAVHVRQGDYAQWEGGKYYKDNAFYNELAKALLIQAQGRKIAIVHNGEFVIDKDIEEKIIVSQVYGDNYPDHVNDILTLSRSEHVIGPYSTFSKLAITLRKRLGLPDPRFLLIEAKTEVQQVVDRMITN